MVYFIDGLSWIDLLTHSLCNLKQKRNCDTGDNMPVGQWNTGTGVIQAQGSTGPQNGWD